MASGTCSNAAALSLDQALRVLAQPSCRVCLYHLVDERIIEYEEATRVLHEVAAAPEPDLTLHHKVIPTLEEVGLIEYDKRSEMIRYQSDPLLEEFLELAAEYDEMLV